MSNPLEAPPPTSAGEDEGCSRSLSVVSDLYVLADGSDYLLYAPLKRLILRVNREAVSLLTSIRQGRVIHFDPSAERAIQKLQKVGLIETVKERVSAPNESSNSGHEFKPTRVTLIPTSDCNLRCLYCYSDAGMQRDYLAYDVACRAIDLVLQNALASNIAAIDVGFMGGGEPFLAWGLMRRLSEYARSNAAALNCSVTFGAVTNGVLSRQQLAWATEQLDHLSISMDGMKDVHDAHRPTKAKGGSFSHVFHTVSALASAGASYSIRSTISSLSVDRMPEIVEFFIDNFRPRRVHLEPLFACGRCRTNQALVPSAQRFVDGFKQCLELAESSGLEVVCSAVRLEALTSSFCGASGENFYVTPEGYVTACTEVSSQSDPYSDQFFVGHYDKQAKRFEFDEERRRRLAARTVHALAGCTDCIAKWHCAGGCAIKAARTGDMFNPLAMDDCYIARNLTEHCVRQLAQGKRLFPARPAALEGGGS
jgi:uncharacterized protein